MHAEPLLVFTLQDLRFRLSKRTHYDAIRAAGLLRQLLLDGEPLIVQANRKLRYEILTSGAWASVQSPDGEYRLWTSVIGPVSVEANEEGFTERVSLAQLLKAPLVRWDRHEFTVAEIIRLAAHVQGGVHKGRPEDEREQILYHLAYLDAAMGQPTYHQGLVQIVCVVTDSLRDLESALAAKWKINVGIDSEPIDEPP